MTKRAAATIGLLALGLALAGPAAARSAKKDLTVNYYEKRIQDLSGSGLTLAFVFKVSNASSAAWYLSGYDYRVVVDNTQYFGLNKALDEPIPIAPGTSTLIALPVKITYDHLFRAIPAASGKDKLGCYLIGGLTFSDEPKPGGDRLAVACSGEFPVYRDLEIVPKPLQVREVTIGGGDMVFKVGLRNSNAFRLQVESLRYVLELGGTVVSQGLLAAGTNLEPRSEQEFTIPLLLDFFELGNSLYALLQKPSVACKFSGTIVMVTDYGRFVMPLDKSEAIPVSSPGR